MNYTIYTDGSDLKHTSRRLGIGAILLGPGGTELDRFGETLERSDMLARFGSDDVSNPTAEMVAALVALRRWGKLLNHKSVTLKADYLGVTKWNTGEWRTKAPYIKEIKNQIQAELKKNFIDVTWSWIPGHQSKTPIYGSEAYWNDQTDKLAKGIL